MALDKNFNQRTKQSMCAMQNEGIKRTKHSMSAMQNEGINYPLSVMDKKAFHSREKMYFCQKFANDLSNQIYDGN